MDTQVIEKRCPIICSNCGVQMVGTNKYIPLKERIYVWYVCPRRKANGETGCGHLSPIELKRGDSSKEIKAIEDHKIIGKVCSAENLTMVIQDNAETFDSWLHHNRNKFKDKRVEIAFRVIEEKHLQNNS